MVMENKQGMCSRIEQEVERRQIQLEQGNIQDVLKEAISVCQNKASKKKIRVELACDSKLTARINSQLLEEAIKLWPNKGRFYNLLGQTQAKNRHITWQKRAEASLQFVCQ